MDVDTSLPHRPVRGSTGRPARGLTGRLVRTLSGAPLRHPVLRSYEVIRSAHLERAHDFTAASLRYARRRYDFDPGVADGLDISRIGTVRLGLTVLLQPVRTLEVNEPLQLSGLPRAGVAVLAARLRSHLSPVLGVDPVRVCSYAIENRDPFADRPARLRSRVRRRGERMAAHWLTRRLDRIAYGTPGAAELYRREFSHRPSQEQTIPALPAPCPCGEPVKESDRVVFVGALHERKGIRELMAAWPHVLTAHPSARLTVVGTGALSEQVEAFAAATESIEFVADPPRVRIHTELRRASVLVLLSQPSPTWREQVGLPLVEALSHGCRVVTTTETGLAEWLTAHGHDVCDPSLSATDTGAVIAAALDRGPDPSGVLADLPQVDGRRAADDWLLDVSPAATARTVRSAETERVTDEAALR